jgi:DNA-binding CsgD family transcriptional regulator
VERLSVAQRNAVRDIRAICGMGLDSRALRTRVAARLSKVVPYDAYCFGTFDPWTLLVTDEVSVGIPAHARALAAHNELVVEDVLKFHSLASSRGRVGILSRAVERLSWDSHRLRVVLPAIDMRHEIRAAFVVGGRCWGGVAMFRRGGRRDFDTADAALLESVSVPVATALRQAALLPGAAGGTAAPAGSGLLLLGPGTEVLASNEAADRWLAEFTPPAGEPARTVPMAVAQVAARAAAAHGLPEQRADQWVRASVRARTRSGRWLAVQGTAVDYARPSRQDIAVIIEPAPASDVAKVLMLAHGLSAREREVVQRVIAATPSTAIARQMQISVHTVQDHLKAVFAKVGVSSRSQLVARLLGQG